MEYWQPKKYAQRTYNNNQKQQEMTNNYYKNKYDKMHHALVKITCYQTIDQLKRDSEKDWGLDYAEALEMAYENMQMEAKQALKNVSVID